MQPEKINQKRSSFALEGMGAGAISAGCFGLIHYLFISDIWFSLPILLIAGAVCGLCIGWTYGGLIRQPTVSSWLGYNALYVGMFALLGGASFLIFEPVISLEALMTYEGLPGFLVRPVLPVTIACILVTTAIIGRLYAQTWRQYGGILVTSAVLALLLGLNVTAMGLVAIPRSSLYLLVEFAGLILALNLVFVVVFMGLSWKTFFGRAQVGRFTVEKSRAKADKPSPNEQYLDL